MSRAFICTGNIETSKFIKDYKHLPREILGESRTEIRMERGAVDVFVSSDLNFLNQNTPNMMAMKMIKELGFTDKTIHIIGPCIFEMNLYSDFTKSEINKNMQLYIFKKYIKTSFSN